MATSKKKIWITASNGFIGRNFEKKLSKNKNIDLISTSRKDINFHNYQKIINFLKIYKPDIIIQTAGIVGGITRNKKEGYELLSLNNSISSNLIRASAEMLPEATFINFCSSCIYPNTLNKRIDESKFSYNNIETTSEAYALAKILSYKMCNLLFDRGLSYINIIPSNLYGPYDNFNPNQSHVIPGLIYKMLNTDNNLTLIGRGVAKRDFLFIDDFVNAVTNIFRVKKFKTNCYNLSSTKIVSIKQLVNLIKKQTKFSHNVKFSNDGNDGTLYKCLNSNKFRKEFGWNELTNLADGLKKTIEWYKS